VNTTREFETRRVSFRPRLTQHSPRTFRSEFRPQPRHFVLMEGNPLMHRHQGMMYERYSTTGDTTQIEREGEGKQLGQEASDDDL
jgi:hypothetical protein